ncbi:MAG: hypothetical protein QXV17_13150 [Candidatus Micrarchaeaceae archaeon]
MKTSTIVITILGIAIIGYLIYRYVYLPRKTNTTTTSSTTLGTTSSSSTTQSSTITSTNKNILTTKSQQLQQILKNSIVHKGNPSTISTGIGKSLYTMGGTVNRNSYSYIQQIEKTNNPFTKLVRTSQIIYGSNNSNYIIHTPKLPHLPILPTLSELKKQNPYLR